jgi:L-ascorbate metabolism protein UlaG (beta-lactamase superfamily)
MTAISVTWIGHGTFQVHLDDKTVLIDPFITGNPTATVKPEDVAADVILVTHGHGDHVGDAVSIATRTGCKVVGAVELIGWLGTQGLDKAQGMGMNTGGSYDFGFCKIKWTMALHSSSTPDGTYAGNPLGVIITAQDGRKLYFAGDTSLFGDMRLIGDEGLALAVLPIGDHYTMGVHDSIRAINLLTPKYAMPGHYNTMPLIRQDTEAWSQRVREETQAKPIVPQAGETVVIP